MLVLKITRTSPTHHRLEYVRDDGSGEAAEIETKSFLKHDLLHCAIEQEAGVTGGFFGHIEQGYSYSDLSLKQPAAFDVGEAFHVERAVSMLTGMTKGMTSSEVMEALQNIYSAEKTDIPSWMTPDLFDRAHTRYNSLMGHWNSLRFGETLEVRFASNRDGDF